VRIFEAGKACDETQGSRPRANEMRYGVVWLDVIEKERRTEAYICAMITYSSLRICETPMQVK